jgi:hypothetical protein
MNVQDFVARLPKARKVSGGWRACCPAHGSSNPTSLSVSEGLDGRILVRCMSQGCGAEEIASSVGLTLSDLFPERDPTLHRVPQMRQHIPAHDVLDAIAEELTVICVIASDMHKGRTISEKDYKRLYLAHERIANAKRLANGER